MVKDAAAQRNAFAVHPEYLESSPRGVASGEWLHDYGLQTSRGFRALKIWMALKEHGVEKFGRLIDQDIAHAHRLSAMIEAEPALELVVPTNINIVCFRHRLDGTDAAALKAFNTEIMLRLQKEGIACVSDTTVHGEYCLRAAIKTTASAQRTSSSWCARRRASADRSPGRRFPMTAGPIQRHMSRKVTSDRDAQTSTRMPLQSVAALYPLAAISMFM